MTDAFDNFPFRGLGCKFFLIGFMGSGKTFWGKKWVQQCGLDFYDLDEVIESAEQKKIAKIFERDGEDYFRHVETSALKTFAEKTNCIIACGGGTPCFNENINWMNENGTTVYLSASPQYIFNRVLEEQSKRPLISKLNKAELLFFIEQKLNERLVFYNQANVILQVEDLSENIVPDFLLKNR